MITWRITFDAEGHFDQAEEDHLVAQLREHAVTDVVMFSHGWNNDEAAAPSLYERWSDLLSAHVGAGREVGFVGIRWPSQLWRDVPIPDFDPTPSGTATGAAGLDQTVTAAVDQPSPGNLDAARESMSELTTAVDDLSSSTSDSC